MKYLCLILFLSGCRGAAMLASPQATAAQNQLDQIKVNAMDAQAHLGNVSINLARNQTEPARSEITLASVSIQRIVPLANQAKVETKKLSNERDDLARQWNGHKDDLKKYQSAHENDWLGPRAHRWLIWLCVVAALLGVGYVMLMAAGQMEGGALAGAMTIAGHIFTFGLKFIGTLFGKAVAWILKATPTNPVATAQ